MYYHYYNLFYFILHYYWTLVVTILYIYLSFFLLTQRGISHLSYHTGIFVVSVECLDTAGVWLVYVIPTGFVAREVQPTTTFLGLFYLHLVFPLKLYFCLYPLSHLLSSGGTSSLTLKSYSFHLVLYSNLFSNISDITIVSNNAETEAKKNMG